MPLKIALPDVVSLQCRQPNLEGTGEIKLRRLVKEALRMRPSRIIVGEVRQEESLDLLIALNSGIASNAQTQHWTSRPLRLRRHRHDRHRHNYHHLRMPRLVRRAR
jgi:Flp pilus assembly CpaF family ATPase